MNRIAPTKGFQNDAPWSIGSSTRSYRYGLDHYYLSNGMTQGISYVKELVDQDPSRLGSERVHVPIDVF